MIEGVAERVVESRVDKSGGASLHIAVTGRVQRVGFRHFVKRAAEALLLTGWVRNLPDGSVEIEVRGNELAVAEFQQKLRQGPPASKVRNLYVTELSRPLQGEGFEILS